MGADLNNIVKTQPLSDDHVQFLVYQILRGLKVKNIAPSMKFSPFFSFFFPHFSVVLNLSRVLIYFTFWENLFSVHGKWPFFFVYIYGESVSGKF